MLTALRPNPGHLLRLLAHRSPLRPVTRRLLTARRREQPHEPAAYWSEEAPRLRGASHGRVGNELRHQAIAVMLRLGGPTPRRVLELGCTFGDLADALEPCGLETYLGVDLSDRVTEEARHRAGRADRAASRRFVAADPRAFEPDIGERFDVIALNEVLYYRPVDDAVRQVQRYGRWLAPGGVLCVSMKRQPKSEAITALLRRRLNWVHGTLLQQQPEAPAHRVRRDRARPAYLIGLMRPLQATEHSGHRRTTGGEAGRSVDKPI
jgi:SAM-dependent methyltransferase